MAEQEVIDIGSLPEQTTTPDDNTSIPMESGTAPTETKRIRWANLWSFLTGGKVIGGNAAGDIMNTNSTQTGTNKRFNGMRLNSTHVIEAVGEDLDKIKDLQEVSALDFAALAGINAVEGGLANAMGNMNAAIAALEEYKDGDLFDALQDITGALEGVPLVCSIEVGMGVGVSSYEISEAVILSALGLSTGQISHVLQVAYYEVNNAIMAAQDPTGVAVHIQTTNGVQHLNKVVFDVTAEKLYAFCFTVRRVV